MPIPQDHDQLCSWRCFVISRWLLDHNIWFACVQAGRLGMNMRRADFLAIVREYYDSETENKQHGVIAE